MIRSNITQSVIGENETVEVTPNVNRNAIRFSTQSTKKVEIDYMHQKTKLSQDSGSVLNFN